MRFLSYSAVLVSICISLSSCASLTPVPGRCGSGPGTSVCLGTMTVPSKEADVFALASEQVVDALHSSAFEESFDRFRRLHANAGAHAQAWEAVNDSTLPRLRRAVQGLEIETYGGIRGWWVYMVYTNLAYDGAEEGPIRINRWGLPRPSNSVANTIAHEAAHRVGLSHPSYRRDHSVGQCEPPYVIGSLVEKTIVGPSWKADKKDCTLLHDS
jgi:hypothetical protein